MGALPTPRSTDVGITEKEACASRGHARPTPHGITHTCVRDTLTPGFPISKLLNLMDILLLKIFRHGLKCVASSPKPFRGP